MALPIQPPWPPAEAGSPLPFDQRSACFPWGPCGPSVKLELRYDVIGVRTTTPMNPIWGPNWHGQTMTALSPGSSKIDYTLTGAFTIPVGADTLRFYLLPGVDELWWVVYQSWVEIAPGVVLTVNAEGACTTQICDDELLIPVNPINNLLDGPEQIAIKYLRWWMTPRYP